MTQFHSKVIHDLIPILHSVPIFSLNLTQKKIQISDPVQYHIKIQAHTKYQQKKSTHRIERKKYVHPKIKNSQLNAKESSDDRSLTT